MVTVRPGDPCPRCGAALTVGRAIEVGHIFQLGRKYTDVFQVDIPGRDGRPVRVTMGCYGIGVSRAVAALAEQTADAHGLCWPAEIAPADVHVVAHAARPRSRRSPRRPPRRCTRRACGSCWTTGRVSRRA